jgi:archaellum biogenesis protein FlaJ (TadC family)
MRTVVRKVAHIFERIGLAMAGAASGLFVGVHVGSSIALLTSQGFLLVMMLSGAVGFYLGIDTPPQIFEHGPSRKVDTAEFLSAAGTFLAALTAFVSVGVIVLRENTHIFWTAMILLAWAAGVTMQIVAGAIARFRAR